MNSEKNLRPFGMRDKIGYAFGDFGCNMSFAFINSYLMIFYVTCMKIKPEHFAVLILLGKIFDAVNDPIIGSLCDASKPGKSGSKFKPWILKASPLLLISSILMFIYVPNAPYWVKIAMCLGLYCIWSVAYTSVNVPYGSMQSCITSDPAGRSDLSTWRSIGAMAAQIPIMIILPLIVYDENDNPRGNIFIIFVAVMGILGLIAFQLLCRMTTERTAGAPSQTQKINYIKTLKAFLQNKHMLGVTISTVSYIALMMTVTTSMPYVFMCYFQNTKLITIATMLAGCPVAIGILLAKPALKKFTKKQLCTYPFLLSAVASGVAAFVKIKNPFIWIALVALAMFGAAFYMTLMWALVADCIDYQERKTGRREESSIYATYSFFRKAAQGIGAAVVSFAIGATGYDEKLGALEQAAGVDEKIYFVTAFLPFIGALISLISMHFLYKLDDNARDADEEKYGDDLLEFENKNEIPGSEEK